MNEHMDTIICRECAQLNFIRHNNLNINTDLKIDNCKYCSQKILGSIDLISIDNTQLSIVTRRKSNLLTPDILVGDINFLVDQLRSSKIEISNDIFIYGKEKDLNHIRFNSSITNSKLNVQDYLVWVPIILVQIIVEVLDQSVKFNRLELGYNLVTSTLISCPELYFNHGLRNNYELIKILHFDNLRNNNPNGLARANRLYLGFIAMFEKIFHDVPVPREGYTYWLCSPLLTTGHSIQKVNLNFEFPKANSFDDCYYNLLAFILGHSASLQLDMRSAFNFKDLMTLVFSNLNSQIDDLRAKEKMKLFDLVHDYTKEPYLNIYELLAAYLQNVNSLLASRANITLYKIKKLLIKHFPLLPEESYENQLKEVYVFIDVRKFHSIEIFENLFDRTKYARETYTLNKEDLTIGPHSSCNELMLTIGCVDDEFRRIILFSDESRKVFEFFDETNV